MKAGSPAPTDSFEVKTVGKSGQISLGKRYAGKMLRLERRDDGTIVLTAVALVPESQLWTTREPDRSRIARGLAWAAEHEPRATTLREIETRAPPPGGRRVGRAAPAQARGRKA